MRKLKVLFVSSLLLFMASSCFEDMDDVIRPATTLDIQNFIYKAMNIWYLYKPDVPDLANDRFGSQADLESYLNTFSSPEDLYYNGIQASHDRFSFMTADYRILLDALAGTTKSHGMEYGLVYYPGSETNLFGYVQYIIPGSDAAGKGLTRGMIFNTVNGAQLTVNNFQTLSQQDSYEIGFAIYDGSTVTPTGQSVVLNKTTLTENPIHRATTLNIQGNKIGYLMYNGFTQNFVDQLNAAFGQFLGEGITDLVLDLRYNGGGSVRTCVDLAGMITGQFNGQVFYTEKWNPELQEYFEQTSPEDLVGKFRSQTATGQNLNSLNLTRLFVLTTQRTASASELLINGLNPYIEVIQIGENTTGKFQASTTFYDSEPPNFRRQGANLGHFYAIQPLIYTTANASGHTGAVDGLPPDYPSQENYADLGVLGNENETLLSIAIDIIVNGGTTTDALPQRKKEVSNSKKHLPTYSRMYTEINEKSL
jgi:carboxyl-terminal processing protease